VLGDLHDRQELIDHLTTVVDSGVLPIEPGQVQLIVQVVEAEVNDRHAKYLARRSRSRKSARAGNGRRTRTSSGQCPWSPHLSPRHRPSTR
jgi:hypothetical protein